MQNKNEIANSLFEAIDIIVDKKLSSLDFDRTIVGEIEGRAERGYKVRYGDTSFIAYSADRGTSYAPGAAVYILIPKNNFSNTKIILSAVGAQYMDLEKIEVQDKIGDMNQLQTEAKDTIVNAINELEMQLGDRLLTLDTLIGSGN